MRIISRLFMKGVAGWLFLCIIMVWIEGAHAGAPLQDSRDKGFVAALQRKLQNTDQSDAPIQGTRWALLVGIASYPAVEGFEIQQLKAPVKDVNALAAFLKDPEKGGFDPDHVFVLTNEEATKRKILMTFNDIANRAAPEDMVIFYFSGHGAPPSDADTTYLIPYDHDLRDIETTCINFRDLAGKIEKMQAGKVVVILDACHSGGVKPKGAKSSGSTGAAKLYLDMFQESEGRALLLSSDESEVSWETEQYGIFTNFLLEGLDGKADTNDDGIVTFTEAARYVEDTVERYTREKFPRAQRPMRRHLGDKERGEIPLAINWDKFNRQKQQDLLDKRNAAIFRASLSGMDQTLKEFSLQVAKSAYDKLLKNESLTERESLLLSEIDALKDGTIAAADYSTRARAIYNLGLTQLRVATTPADARVTLLPADAPDRVISPSSPNAYQVEQGRYRLSVERPGYAPHSRELTLAQASEAVTVTLERLTGILQLQVDPADAVVTVTPISIAAPDAEIRESKAISVQSIGERKLPIGTYRVTAQKEGYESVTKESVEIKVNATIQVTITLSPVKIVKPEPLKPATITAPDLPEGTRVFVDGNSVALPYELPPGNYGIRLERDGFKAIEMREALNPGQVLTLRPEWVPMSSLTPSSVPRGIPRAGAVAASLVVPGLGQHLQRHHIRGAIYEAAAVIAGSVALWAAASYQQKLDDYNDIQDQLRALEPSRSLSADAKIDVQKWTRLLTEGRSLMEEQEKAHDEAESARTLTLATQIILGVIWGANALDAGIIKSPRQVDRVTFEAHPTYDGIKVLVRAPF